MISALKKLTTDDLMAAVSICLLIAVIAAWAAVATYA